MPQVTALLLLALFIPACAVNLNKPHPVIYGNLEYPNKEAALDALRADLRSELESVDRRPYQGGSLLIYHPSDQQLTQLPYLTQPVPSQQYMYSFWLAYWKADLSFQQSALTKSGIFDSVELKRVDGYESYAYDYGYRYLLVKAGENYELQDMVTGDVKNVSGPPGGKNFVGRVEGAVRRFASEKAAPVARGTQPASDEGLRYDAGSRQGRISIRGTGFEGRARLIASIGRVCSSKNVMIQAGQGVSADGGLFEMTDESLVSEVLQIDFVCVQ